MFHYLTAYTERYRLYIGHIALGPKQTFMSPKPVNNLRYELNWNVNSNQQAKPQYHVTLLWDPVNFKEHFLRHYDIYKDARWVGRTFSNAFVVDARLFEGSRTASFSVQPVTIGFQAPPTHEPIVVNFDI